MAVKSKSGLSATPTKVSPPTPRVGSKQGRVLAKPEPGSPSHLQATRHSGERSQRSTLSSKVVVDGGAPKVEAERGSPSPLRGTRHLDERSPRSPVNSKMAIDRRAKKVEPEPDSPLKGTRFGRSARSALNMKPTGDRGSPKVATVTEKLQIRVGKGSELQAQLNSVQDDLNKAKEKISLIEKEKAQAIEELKAAQEAADEANEKLREALVAKQRAEESLEIEKFQTVESEQAGLDAGQMKDEKWLNEIESIRNKHGSDAAALSSTIEELERVKQELAMVCDEKTQALNQADDATKIAQIHAEEVEFLSAELVRLKSLIDSESEKETNENKEMVIKCKEETESLKQQFEEAKSYEEKLMEKEAFIKQLAIDLEAARIAESYALNVVAEWKKRFEELQLQIAEAKKLERSATESLDSVMKQLEDNNTTLLDARSEIASLKEKVGLLEVTINKQLGDLMESEQSINKAKEETKEVTKLVESLKSELEMVKEEKTRALNNEKIAASSVQTLLEERTELVDKLENSRDEIEKSKKEMESLASALNQVSSEAREAKEKLLSSEKQHEHYETKLEELKSVLKATNEKYERMLGDAKKEIDLLTSAIELSKNEYQESGTECERNELHLVDNIKKILEEKSSQEKEISRLVSLLKQSQEEVYAYKEEEARLKASLEEVESEVIYLQETLSEVNTESRVLKASLLDKETELQSVVRTNEELRAREAASLKKAEELSKLLEEATMKKQREVNEVPSNCEKDYDLQPKAVAVFNENPKLEPLEVNDGSKDEALQADEAKVENANEQQPKEAETKHNKDDDSSKVEFNIPEREAEQKSLVPAVDLSKGLIYQINGLSNSKQKQQQKKKKDLLGKFVSLLKKKKGSNN